MIDLHAHILPGFDDGVRSLEQARDLARAAAAEGVTAIAATPHVRDDFPTTAEQMERGVERLRADFAEQAIPVDVLYGGEVSFGRVWEFPDDVLLRFSLAHTGRYVLVEFPYRGWPPLVDQTVQELVRRGVTPLVAHPERSPDVQADPDRVETLVAAGALVQLTAASVEGRLGEGPRAAAARLLERRLAHVIATDAHGPHIREGGLASSVRAVGNEQLSRYLTTEAPEAIAAGRDVPPPPDAVRSPQAP
jgi:protein-tyrosine phosphatase